MSNLRRLMLSLMGLAVLFVPSAKSDEPDLLEAVRERTRIEAQRVEKEFTEGRSAAYKFVRRDDPKLVEATEKLHAILALVRNDNSLDSKRRELFLVTLKADLDRVRDLATAQQRSAIRSVESLSRSVARDMRSSDIERQSSSTRRVTDEGRSIMESRTAALAGDRSLRLERQNTYGKVMSSVAESAIPEYRDMRFPKNWVELSKKRSDAVKMSAKERAIMKSLGDVSDVDFSRNTLDEVVDYMRKRMGVEIIVDKRALEEVSVTSDSPLSLKLRTSNRTILKRLLADLGLTYVIKDEAILITSRDRAREMTTTRTYYLGDLVAVIDSRLPPVVNQLAMLENANRLVTMITQNVDAQSWKVNNPDAAGAIVFDPTTFTLIVKQTAEVHFLMSGYR